MAGEVFPAGEAHQESRPRLARLDGLRGLAACVVAFAYHSRLMFVDGAFAHAGPVVGWLHTWGWTFVDLFFLISGYIFAHTYLGARQLAERHALARFAVARVARLYPLHLVMLLVAAALFWGKPGNDGPSFLAHLLMLQGFTRPFADTFDGPSWSLTVECLCYLLFAIAAYASSRVLAGVTAVAVLWGGTMLALHGLPGGPWVGDVLPRGVLGFFMGQALWHGRERIAGVPIVVLVCACTVGVALDPGRWSYLLPLDLLAWPAALLLCLRLPLFESPPMLWLGERSFAIYLVHMPLLEFVTKVFGPFRGGLLAVGGVHLVLVAIVLALADTALRRIERPARTAIRAAWARRAPSPVLIEA